MIGIGVRPIGAEIIEERGIPALWSEEIEGPKRHIAKDVTEFTDRLKRAWSDLRKSTQLKS